MDYGNGSAKNLAIIQKIFNFAARIISGKRKFDQISGVRESLGWLESPDFMIHQTPTLLHKIRSNGLPEPLAARFFTNRERPDHVRSTRQDNLLSLPLDYRGSAAGKRQFAYRAAEQFNSLPPEFTGMTVPLFKRSLKKRLVSERLVSNRRTHQ